MNALITTVEVDINRTSTDLNKETDKDICLPTKPEGYILSLNIIPLPSSFPFHTLKLTWAQHNQLANVIH